MRILVVHGSHHGATRELAEVVAATLRSRAHDVDVRDGREVDGIERWDAVIVGGALYAFRWTPRAGRFVRRHARELREVPVWFFSSGPLDDSASEGEISPTGHVARLMKKANARGHVTFGGKLDPEEHGRMAKNLAEAGMSGDFRDMDAVAAWADTVADELEEESPRVRELLPERSAERRRTRRAAAGLTLFTGLTAIAGGLELMIFEDGAGWLPPPAEALAHSPFADYFLPGLILLVCVGLASFAAGVLVIRRHASDELAVAVAGALLTGYIAIEMYLLRSAHPLQIAYLVIGLLTMAAAARLWSLFRTPRPRREALA